MEEETKSVRETDGTRVFGEFPLTLPPDATFPILSVSHISPDGQMTVRAIYPDRVEEIPFEEAGKLAHERDAKLRELQDIKPIPIFDATQELGEVILLPTG